jgi:hypothetical protein
VHCRFSALFPSRWVPVLRRTASRCTAPGHADDGCAECHACGKSHPGRPLPFRSPQYADTKRGKDLLRKEAYRLVSIREGGLVRQIPAIRAAVRGLFIAAAKGKPSALKSALTILESLQTIQTRNGDHLAFPCRHGANAKIERVIVEPYPGGDQMTPAEREEFERLLAKARSR